MNSAMNKADLDILLTAAQTLRIQQVQATADWKPEYKAIADKAWQQFNEAHRRLYEGGAEQAEELEALREILKMTEDRLGEYLRGETLSKGKLRSMALIIGRALE